MTILDDIVKTRFDYFPYIQKLYDEVIENSGNQGISNSNERKTLSEVLSEISNIGIISELKCASPSEGSIIKNNFKKSDDLLKDSNNYLKQIKNLTMSNIKLIINDMVSCNAIGISVLVEPLKFHGSYGNLKYVNDITPLSVPILLKEFIVEEVQLKLGKIYGASNALLIASICEPLQMAKKMVENGLEPLVEIHDENDLNRIVPLKEFNSPFIIGINNRNLKDLSIDLDNTIKLIPKIREIFGPNQIIISESGIFTRNDILKVEKAGAKAALIGTSIIRSDVRKKMSQLLNRSFPYTKICGIQSLNEISFLKFPVINSFGMIVDVPTSSRNLTVNLARNIIQQSPNYFLKVIVIKSKNLTQIISLNEELKPDLIQIHNFDELGDLGKISQNLLKKFILSFKLSSSSSSQIIQTISALPDKFYAILLDPSEGTGKKINIIEAKKIVDAFPLKRIIIAGGIDNENVAELYDKINPFGVDISSSVENNGKKSAILVNHFTNKIQNIRK